MSSRAAKALIPLVVLLTAHAATCPASPASAQVDHWRQLRPSGRIPPGLQFASGAYDPGGHRMLVFGGTDQAVDYNSVWALDLTKDREEWAQLRPYGQPPYYRRGAAMAFDPERRALLVFGGLFEEGGDYFDDAWLLDLSQGDGAWQKVAASGDRPAERMGASMVFQSLPGNPPVRRMLLFGGSNAAGRFNDAWSFNMVPGQEGWSPLSPSGAKPSERDFHAAVYDAANGRMILFGGREGTAARPVNDVWSLDLTPGAEQWTRLAATGTAPPALTFLSAVYDPCRAHERMLLFGGYTGIRSSGDTWSLTLDTPRSEAWMKLDPTGARPTPRDSHVSAYDPRSRRLVIYGGWDGPGALLRDTWALDLVPCSVPTVQPTQTEEPTPTERPVQTEVPTPTAPGSVTPTLPGPPATATATRAPTSGAPCDDAYEPDDSWTRAKILEVGAVPQRRTFGRSGDADFVKLIAAAGQSYVVRTLDLARGLDTRLYLYGPDGTTQLAWNDDDPQRAPASTIEWTCPASGSYFVMAVNLDPDAAGCDSLYSLEATLAGGPRTATPGWSRSVLPIAYNVAFANLTTPTPESAGCDPGFESGRLSRPLSGQACRRDELTSAQRRKLDATLLATVDALREPGHQVQSAAPLPDGAHVAVRPDTQLRVIVETSDQRALAAEGVVVRGRVGEIVAGVVPASALDDVARLPGVRRMLSPEPQVPCNDMAAADTRVPQVREMYGATGRGVVVAFIDSGIEFRHDSFRDAAGRTRIRGFLNLSDPGDTDLDGDLDGPGPGGGTLFTEADINRELELEAAGLAKDYDVEAVPIPDGGSGKASVTVTADDSVTIESFHVRLVLDHPSMDDLALALVAPDGTRIPFGGTRNAVGATLIATYDFPSLAGRSSAGTWTVEMSDNAVNGSAGAMTGGDIYVNRPVRLADRTGHGTQVAGTAAGDDAGPGGSAPGPYAGMAPDADLVVVRGYRETTSLLSDDAIVALQWIDEFATARGQPYVVAYTHGSYLGRHDGSDPIEQAIDAIVGAGRPGKVVVAGVGNRGATDAHASGVLGPANDTLHLNIELETQSEYLNVVFGGPETARLGVSFPQGADLKCLSYDSQWQDKRSDCDSMAVTPGTYRWFTLSRGSVGVNYGRLVWDPPRPGVEQHLIELRLYGWNEPIVRGPWGLRIGNGQGRWDSWSYPDAVSVGGDSSMGVGVPASARNVLAVGAHLSRIEWTDHAGARQVQPGAVGEIWARTSRGPTRDGRIKPDLTAPGAWLVTSSSPVAPVDEYTVGPGLRANGGGTSTASAVVAGAVAVLLSLPGGDELDAPTVRSILASAARRDSYTGSSPDGNRWGGGKLDLLASVRAWKGDPSPSPTASATSGPPATSTPVTPTPTPADCWFRGGELPADTVVRLDDGFPALAGARSLLLGDPSLGPGKPGSRPVPIGSAWVEQKVDVPDTSAPSLHLVYKIVTYDVAQDDLRQVWDVFEVGVSGSVVLSDGNVTSRLPGNRTVVGAKSAVIDLAPWRGQSVTLRLANWNGRAAGPGAQWYNTWTYVDDVYVMP